ncbi:MAG: phosphatidylserine decarboxylase [Deltaproteobacteria bacterium]|nr:phosphatidylserine decarboxylase [Deltaproteobacteria bacterium]
MERITTIMIAIGVIVVLFVAIFLFWRYVWFFRNPHRSIPPGDNIVSPADGAIVYVRRLVSDDDVIVLKQGLSAKISDIINEDVSMPKVVIGTFMSPLDVHYNRSPIKGRVDFIRHYPAKTKNLNMSSMQFRTLFKVRPYYWNSKHIVENERAVTRIVGLFKGRPISIYVVQIAGGHVSGIDTYLPEGSEVSKGEVFGMIRIGSQVDLILPDLPNMKIRVSEGDSVKAGESVLVE